MSFFVRTVSEVDNPEKIWLQRGKLVIARDAQPYAHPSAARLAIELMYEKHVKLGEAPLAYVYMKDRDAPEEEWVTVSGPAEKSEPNILEQAGDLRIIRFKGKWEVVRVVASAPSLIRAQQEAQVA